MYTKANGLRLLLIACLLGVLTVASCKKDNGPKTRHELVSGTWQLTQVGPDANNNGILDSGEVAASASIGYSALITLNGDGTGNAVYTQPGTAPDTIKNMKWDLVDNENTIRTIDGTDTSRIIIHAVDDLNLTVLDMETAPPVALWEIFIKQQ